MRSLFLAFTLLLLCSPAFAIFTNGGFEDNSFTGWTITTGLNGFGLSGSPPYTGASIRPFDPGGANTSAIIKAPYTDPRAPHLVFPFHKDHTARVGDTTASYNTNIMAQQDVITPADRDPSDGNLHVRFSYAAVLEDPSHSTHQQPYFYVALTDITTGTVLHDSFDFARAASGYYHDTRIGTVTWRSTDMIDVDIIVPDTSLGHILEIKVIAAGCSLGGHAAYVYLDGFGSKPLVLPEISVSKTTTTTSVLPNATVDYVATVTNAGTVAADATEVTIDLPAGIIAFDWTCAATGGAVCPNPSGTGAINEIIATLPVGGELVYSIMATAGANPPAAVISSISALPPNGGTCAPGSTAGPCVATVTLTPEPLVDLTMTGSASSYQPGNIITYTLVVTNAGNVAADGTRVTDPAVGGLEAYNWTCAADYGAVCSNASGKGEVDETIMIFPVGGIVTFTVSATVSANPPATIVNAATAAPPGSGICMNGNAVCNASHSAMLLFSAPASVPGLSRTALLLLAALLLGMALTSRRGRAQ